MTSEFMYGQTGRGYIYNGIYIIWPSKFNVYGLNMNAEYIDTKYNYN